MDSHGIETRRCHSSADINTHMNLQDVCLMKQLDEWGIKRYPPWRSIIKPPKEIAEVMTYSR
ncbi:MAG: hypothetical protein ACLTS6_12195 [Anaerobutyricum sp.]